MPRPQRIARIVALSCLTLLAGLTGSSRADVRLPHIFGDHMVLQREKPVRVWGWADTGEKVTLTIGSEHASKPTRSEETAAPRAARMGLHGRRGRRTTALA